MKILNFSKKKDPLAFLCISSVFLHLMVYRELYLLCLLYHINVSNFNYLVIVFDKKSLRLKIFKI